MATEKQRRRRAKEKRHAYDLVEIDDEGNETVVRATEVRPPEQKKQKQSGGRRSGGGRVPQPPSWNRVLKRGALFAPVFFVIVYILGGKQISVVGALVNAAFLMLVFVPFSYFLDGFVYRQHLKRNPGAAKR